MLKMWLLLLLIMEMVIHLSITDTVHMAWGDKASCCSRTIMEPVGVHIHYRFNNIGIPISNKCWWWWTNTHRPLHMITGSLTNSNCRFFNFCVKDCFRSFSYGYQWIASEYVLLVTGKKSKLKKSSLKGNKSNGLIVVQSVYLLHKTLTSYYSENLLLRNIIHFTH